MTTQPDLFINVHKGLRRALFEVCVALGRAGDDPERGPAARRQLAEVLHFVTHHGENEDLLLIPLLEAKAPAIAQRLARDHARIDAMLATLRDAVGHAPLEQLYGDSCALTAAYLDHLGEEERLEPELRAALTDAELAGFGPASIARTEPTDQRMMLGWMLPAMTGADGEALLASVPEPVATQLRALVD